MGCSVGISSVSMAHSLGHFYLAWYWRPKYRKDVKLVKFVWREVYEAYDTIMKGEKNLISCLVKGDYGEGTMERAFNCYVSISSAWYGIVGCRKALDAVKHKDRLTLEEKAIYEEYRRMGYLTFHRCREMYLDAKVMAGKLTQEGREKDMLEFVLKWGITGSGYENHPLCNI